MPDCSFLALVFFGLLIIHIVVSPLAWVGDEPSYCFQGVGLFSNLTFLPSDARWHDFLARSDLAAPGTNAGQTLVGKPYRSLAPSLVGGAALATLGLEPARWLNCVLGFVGIVLLLSILKSSFGGTADPWRSAGLPAYFSITATAFSLPLLAYLKLLYPEVPLFVAVCATFASLRARASHQTIAWAVLLPFVYIRALPLAFGFAGLTLLQQYRNGARPRVLLSLVALFVSGLSLFAFYQLKVFGQLNGGVFAPYTPSLRLLPERLGMQMFDVRHGLVAYSPIFLVGFAGLILGAARRVPACVDAAVLLSCYVLTFIWSTASESWTARFWVAGLPFVAVGLCYWLRSVNDLTAYAAAGVLTCVTLANSVLFTLMPMAFLGNRKGPLTYSILFKTIPVHLGLFLPVDGADAPVPVYARPVPYLLAFAVLTVGMLVLCTALQGRSVRRLAGLIALVLTLVPFAVCAARAAPADTYSISVQPDGNGIKIHLHQITTHISAVQMDDTFLRNWWGPGAPNALSIRCYDRSGGMEQRVESSRALFAVLDCVREIDVEGLGITGSGHFFDGVRNVTLIQRLL